MDAETLNCPMCGAPSSSDSTACEHCGARLATIACPSCFGMMFLGAKFCSHCGARAERTELADSNPEPCPRCKTLMTAVVIGNTNLRECPGCEGIWATAAALEQICADGEKQAAVLGAAVELPAPDSGGIESVRYMPCPACKSLMNRVNFASCSRVVVDVCKAHGTWFDRDELRRIVEFIRAGGMDAARAREIADLEQRRRQASPSGVGVSYDDGNPFGQSHPDGWDLGIAAVGIVIKELLR